MRRTPAGMTLLELMVVVAIAGIFASLSVAGFQAMTERQRISGAEREVLLTMQEARQQARGSRQPVRLWLYTVTENGLPVTRLRWEKLPCADSWGATCPTSACQTGACGAGCACTTVGTPVIIPRGLNVNPLHGLCWLGDSGAAVKVSGSTTCLATGTKPSASDLVLKRGMVPAEEKPDQVLVVDGLTGAIRPVDCESYPSTPGCT